MSEESGESTATDSSSPPAVEGRTPPVVAEDDFRADPEPEEDEEEQFSAARDTNIPSRNVIAVDDDERIAAMQSDLPPADDDACPAGNDSNLLSQPSDSSYTSRVVSNTPSTALTTENAQQETVDTDNLEPVGLASSTPEARAIDQQQRATVEGTEGASSSAEAVAARAASNEESMTDADTKASERLLGPSIVPGAVAVHQSSRTQTEVANQTSIALPTVTILAQPQPYQNAGNDDELEIHSKAGERQYQEFAGVSSVPGAVSTIARSAAVDQSETETDTLNVAERGDTSSYERITESVNPNLQPNSESNTPQATEQDRQTGLVTATPIEAVIVAEAVQVTIDEEHASDEQENCVNGECEQERAAETSDGNEGKMSYSREKRSDRIHLLMCIFVTLVLVGIMLAIVLPLTGRSESPIPSRSDDRGNTNGPAPPNTAPKFDYPCYTSTLQILIDQLEDVNHVNDTYILCPNTRIQVGTFSNPEADEWHFVQGDYPIWVVRPGITVQCGLDGRSENNCTVDGGILQVVFLSIISIPPEYAGSLAERVVHEILVASLQDKAPVLEDVSIRGITFIGRIRHSGPFRGTSVTASQPGTFIFEDCLWEGLSISSGLITVSRNEFLQIRNLPVADNSIAVKISNSSFTNIRFDAPLMIAVSQSLVLEGCLVDGVVPSALATPVCNLDLIDDVVKTEGGCAGLLYCAGTAVCSISNSCVQDSATTGPAIVYFTHNTSKGDMVNNYLELGSTAVDQTHLDGVGAVDLASHCEWALGTESVYPDPEESVGSFTCFEAFKAEKCSLPVR